tara:strand:+ start:139 stop:261 length:123 start_codon:yes stop_codon:yes gene_type:complete
VANNERVSKASDDRAAFFDKDSGVGRVFWNSEEQAYQASL